MVIIHLILGLCWYWQNTYSAPEIWLREVNKIRSQGCICGNRYYPPVQPVQWNVKLAHLAQKHSEDMAIKGYFHHVSPSGKNLVDRLNQAGIGWINAAENIFLAKGFKPTPSEVVLNWKNSPGHCQNLLHPLVTDMGIGEYQGHYTQMFIRPKNGN